MLNTNPRNSFTSVWTVYPGDIPKGGGSDTGRLSNGVTAFIGVTGVTQPWGISRLQPDVEHPCVGNWGGGGSRDI